MYDSLPSLNECQGEFLSKNIRLYNEYLNLHTYSEWPSKCSSKTNFLIFKIKKPDEMTITSDPRDSSAPTGYRYLYYDELAANENIKQSMLDNLVE